MNKVLKNPRARIAVLAVLVVAAGYFLLRGRSQSADPTAGLPVDPSAADSLAGGGGADALGATPAEATLGPLPDNKFNEAAQAAVDTINATYYKMKDELNAAADAGAASFGSGNTGAIDTAADVLPSTPLGTGDLQLIDNITPYTPGFATLSAADLAAAGVKPSKLNAQGYVVQPGARPANTSPIGTRSGGFIQVRGRGGASNARRTLSLSGDGSAAAPGNAAAAAAGTVPALTARLLAALRGIQLQPLAQPTGKKKRRLPVRGALPHGYISTSGARVVIRPTGSSQRTALSSPAARDFSPIAAALRSLGTLTPSRGAPARLGGGGGFVVQAAGVRPAPRVATPALVPLGGAPRRSTVLAL